MFILNDKFFLVGKASERVNIETVFPGCFSVETLPLPEYCYHTTRPPYIKFNDLDKWEVNLANDTVDNVTTFISIPNIDTQITSHDGPVDLVFDIELKSSTWSPIPDKKVQLFQDMRTYDGSIIMEGNDSPFPLYKKVFSPSNISCNFNVRVLPEVIISEVSVSNGKGSIAIPFTWESKEFINVEFTTSHVNVRNKTLILKKIMGKYYIQ